MPTRYKDNSCYYCGKPASGMEHAPPRMMFRGFECDSLTVPSCEEHNNHKSGDDQRVVAAFLIPLCNWIKDVEKKGRGIHEDVRKAIEIGQSSFDRTKRWSFSRQLFKDASEWNASLPEVSYLMREVSIHQWVRKLSAAVISAGIGQSCDFVKWNAAVAWSPDFVRIGPEAQLTLNEYGERMERLYKEASRLIDNFKWLEGWSAYPKPYPASIYNFKICFRKRDTIVLHRFYDQFRWFVFIPTNSELNNLLNDMLSAMSRSC